MGRGGRPLLHSARGLVARDQRTQYKFEVLAVSLLDIGSALVEMGNKTLRMNAAAPWPASSYFPAQNSSTSDLVLAMRN